MRYVLILALTLLPSLAFAQANALIFQQRNANDNGIASRLAISPNDDAFFYSDPVSRIPRWLKAGPSCVFGPNTFDCGLTPDWANVQGPTAFGRNWALLADSAAATALLGVPTATSQLTNDSGFLTSLPFHNHDAGDITTGVFSTSRIPALEISKTNGLQDALDGKYSAPSGTTSEYLRGDGSIATFPTTLAPSGAAGGDLSGSYPNPVLAATGVSPGTYSAVTVDSKGRVTAGSSRTFNYVTRALNTCFQASATRDTQVSYSVTVTTVLSESTGEKGTVYLRHYADSTCSSGPIEVDSFVIAQQGSVGPGEEVIHTATAKLSGVIPAGLWVRIVTVDDIGSPDFTPRLGQEVGL